MNVAIVGATGYGGIQAVNLLKKNKKYKISFLGGNKTSGSKWNDNFPFIYLDNDCLLYTSPSPRDYAASRMPSSA